MKEGKNWIWRLVRVCAGVCVCVFVAHKCSECGAKEKHSREPPVTVL